MEQSSLKHTPIYDEHLRAKARMVPFTGYSMPVQYTGLVDEHHLVRRAAGLFDVSHMGELVITGPGATQAVDRLVTNDVQGLIDGQARYTVCCNEGGTILDDLIIYRVAADNVLVVCNASNREKIVGHFTQQLKATHEVRDISDDTALIALQGPRAMEVLRGAVGDGRADELPAFHFADIPVFNVPCTVSRTGYTGEDGVEIFCPPGEAARIWRSLLGVGESAGLRPAGLGARNTLRLECRMALYGNDIDETTNPLEAGLGWVVRLDKAEFVGRDAQAGGLRDDRQGHRAGPLAGDQRVRRGCGRGDERLALADPGEEPRAGLCADGVVGGGFGPAAARPGAWSRGQRGGGEDAVLQARSLNEPLEPA